jgi:hypothetical protein
LEREARHSFIERLHQQIVFIKNAEQYSVVEVRNIYVLDLTLDPSPKEREVRVKNYYSSFIESHHLNLFIDNILLTSKKHSHSPWEKGLGDEVSSSQK